jgi:branched-chain amino acid transport system substrate-binding protein
MHNLLATATVLTGLVLSAAGCATAGSSSADGSGGSGPLKVGYIGALSGGSASLGVPGRNGIQLAVDKLNAGGGVAGRKIDLVAYDDKADPATSATAAQKLITQDKVVAVLGGPNSGTVKANNVIIAGAGVPELVTIAQEDTLIDSKSPGFPLTFRITEDNSYDVDAIAALFKKRAYKSICVLADTTAYGEGGLASIRTVFDKKGLAVHSVARHPVNATDMTAQTLSLRNAGCDSIYLYSLGPDGALFLKTLAQIGWQVPVIGGRGLAAKAFLSLGGAAAEGLVLPGVLDPNKPAGKAFAEAYDAKFGPTDDPAHVYSALGYDSMMMLAAALKTSGGKGKADLARALEKTSLTDAVSGRTGSTLSFGPDRHQAPGDKYLVFYEIRDSTYKFLTADV